MASRLILLRHGETGANGRYFGATDIPLAQQGREQIVCLAPRVQKMGVDAVWVSPRRRCRETLDLLALPHRFQLEDDLREVDFGQWEGLTFSEMVKRDPLLVDQWARGDTGFTFPGGDSLVAFNQRIAQVAERLCDCDAETILLVSHGGVIRGLICQLLGLSLNQSLLFQQASGRYAVLDIHDGRGVLVGFNRGGAC